MSLFGFFNKLMKRQDSVSDGKDAMSTIRNWYTDRYENAVMQRNLMFLVLLVSLVIIGLSLTTLRYIKNSKSIEPFVIEIDPKTGVPTVVDPVTTKIYSGDDVVRRYFVWQYIKAREEYYDATFQYSYNTVVRVFSSPEVYLGDYRRNYGVNNPASPVNTLGKIGYRQAVLKSMVFPTDKTVQVRFALQTLGTNNQGSQDKIAFMQFDFEGLRMNDDERLINPLGFRVTLYRLEDERVQ